MAPNLVYIPPEIQGLIAGYLCTRDQNCLSRTCKTLKTVVLAKLYECVIIKVPTQWSRLAPLENLLGSAGGGLKYTTEIRILVKQQLAEDDSNETGESQALEEAAGESSQSFGFPKDSASKSLNALVRLLVMRVPSDNLESFHWYTSCTLEAATLTLLFKHQGATLHSFGITRHSEPWNISNLPKAGLQILKIRDLNIEQRCEWLSELIIQSRETLWYLHLGVLSKVAQDYAVDPRPGQHTLPGSFADMAKEALPASEGEAMPKMSLKILGLSGLNLEDIVGGAIGLEIDFNILTALTLESCSGLNQAFARLIGDNGSRNASSLKLTNFSVRQEDGDHEFAQHLTDFLTSFAGLIHLCVLLDGQSQAMRKEPILEMHGKTLQSLVWEERRRPRKDTKIDTSFISYTTLDVISRKCQSLRALGLPVRWEAIAKSTTTHPRYSNLSRRMPKLRTLHIRNLPPTELNKSYLPTDYMIKGLAYAVLDAFTCGNSSTRQKSITTIAVGAPVYRDIHIGSSCLPSNLVRGFLQLRVYHVDHEYQSILGPSPVVTQVAKGTADDATTCVDKDILHKYWLA